MSYLKILNFLISTLFFSCTFNMQLDMRFDDDEKYSVENTVANSFHTEYRIAGDNLRSNNPTT